MRAVSQCPSARIARAVSRVLRTLPLWMPAALLPEAQALAQAVAPQSLKSDIPAQPLSQALAAFADQTGLQLVYVSDVVRNQQSHAAAAGSSAPDALASILEGTGLRFESLTRHSVRIVATTSSQSQKPRSAAAAQDDLSEVIVTANRREQRVHDVPITIEVLTSAMLADLNATTLDDFAGFLPGVTVHGFGPGQNSLYMRGLGTGEVGVQAGGFNASFPSVAVYLDEQSAQLPIRNLDIYTADLERIEVLEGPQGTLFGAGAQAGVLRYITNKPKIDVTEGSLSAGYANTAHGAPGNSLSAVLNLPLIDRRLAMRAVVYHERRGGYIDNTPATFARAPSDLGVQYIGGLPADSVAIDNFALVGRDINPVTYQGGRAEASYRFDDDWQVLIAQSYQSVDAEGVFTEMAANALGAPQPPLTVQLFNPSYDRDRFENTALTVEGRLGWLKILYTGAYLVRNVEQVQDYTAYTRGGIYVDYYQCVHPDPTSAAFRCFTPSSTWRDIERNTHQSHELRLTTPGDWRLRGVGGLFFENYLIQDQTDWFYLTATPYFHPIAPPTGYWAVNGSPILPSGETVDIYTNGATFVPGAASSNNPNVRPPNDAFFNDVTRGYRQKAAYASLDFDLLPHRLTLTLGTRYSSTHSSEVGSTVNSFDCELATNPPNPCRNRNFTNLNALGLSRTYAGFQSRANLSWSPTETALFYYTWSQGFRAGGFNRGFLPPYTSPLAGSNPEAMRHGGFVSPLGYAPDTLTNNELGWKASWLDGRLQWNGALYQELWDHVQIGALDTGLVGGATINGGDYRVRGLETYTALRALEGLTIEVGAAWNHSALVREAQFHWADGTPIDFSTLPGAVPGQTLSNPAGVLGSPLAGAPTFQGNLRARYELQWGDYRAFVQAGAVYQSHSLASTDQLSLDHQGNPVAYELPPFTTLSAALGVARGAWLLQLSGENLTDTRAELYANYRAYFKAITVARPRTVGLRLTYTFGSR